jgi:glycosyltransferase involved in cell wall biosynthesis
MRYPVRNLLLLISSLDYNGPARRLCLLARGLSREAFRVRVVVLETATPWVESLRQAGIAVDVLGWKRPIDAQPFVALCRLLRAERPEVVHVFGMTALRALKVCGYGGHVLASGLLHGGLAKNWVVDRWLLRGRMQLLAFGAAEAQRYRSCKWVAAPIVQATPGIDLSDIDSAATNWPDRRVVLCLGPLEVHKGYRDAVWAFDILHYLFDDLRLAFLGDGPDRPRVEQFAHSAEVAKRLAFLGRRPHIEPYLRRAAAVWIPSYSAGGMCAALEALAAGRPVVATRVPELEEVLVDGETGYLVPPGDKVALARQTRILLDDPGLANRFAEAGRKRVAERFSAARMVAECTALYEQFSE